MTYSLLTNDEVLAVNRKSTGNRQLWRRDDLVAWVADVPGSKDRYVALFNAQDQYRRDDKRAAFSARVTRETPGQSVEIDLPLNGAKRVWLVADDGGDGNFADHVIWAHPRVTTGSSVQNLTKWVSATQGYGQTRLNANAVGKPLGLNGKDVALGIGSHAPSTIVIDLPEGATRFQATAGLEREGANLKGGGGTLQFHVFTQDPMVGSSLPTASVSVDWADLGLSGGAKVRDLWSHRDLGLQPKGLTVQLPWHGAGLYRVSPTRQ